MIDKDDEQIPFDEEYFHNVLDAINSLDDAAPSDEEADYRTIYFKLYNGISLILENTHTYEQTTGALKVLQCKAEDFYISQGEIEI